MGDDCEQAKFMREVDTVVEAKVPDFTKTLNIVVVGKVSSGKSSLLNALLLVHATTCSVPSTRVPERQRACVASDSTTTY